MAFDRLSNFLMLSACLLGAVTALSNNIRGRMQSGMDPNGRFAHILSLCSEMPPETAQPNTECWSSCGASISNVTCNGQIDSIFYNMEVSVENIATTDVGDKDCSGSEHRVLCVAKESNGRYCAGLGNQTLTVGATCYTDCGEVSCPERVLVQGLRFQNTIPQNDFKINDCDGGYRTRCKVAGAVPSVENNPGSQSSQNVTVEI